MLKVLTKLFPAVLLLLAASCSTSEIALDSEKYVVANHIETSEILAITNEVSNIVEQFNQEGSRGGDVVEQSIKIQQTERAIAEKSVQLVEEGINIRNQVVQIGEENKKYLPLTQEETNEILSMTDDQLALCALLINSIGEVALDNQSAQRQLVSNLYLNCLLHSAGVDDIIDIWGIISQVGTGGMSISAIAKGTKLLISATTTKQILGALAMRAAGWLGFAVMLVKFGTCVKDGQNS